MKILIVDDDRHLVELLSFVLEREGFTPLAAHDVATALSLAREQRPDLVLLDINLRPGNGFELLGNLRSFTAVPIVMLSARRGEDDKVRGLELGADDYVPKPFGYRELVARVRAQLRRYQQAGSSAQPAQTVFEAGPVRLNTVDHTVTKQGRPVDLTATEFRLLHYLMLNAGAVVPTRTLLKQVWGYDNPSGNDVVRVTLYRLRRKIEDDPLNPALVHTIPGVGVILRTDDPAKPSST